MDHMRPHIAAVWSSLSSDVRKCVNLERESGGCRRLGLGLGLV